MLDRLRDPRLFVRLCLASVVANAAIVVTGGVVRLTDSGLGCPTWPTCTDTSYTPAYAVHGLIEFGNRMLTFALTVVVLATLVTAFLQRRDGRPRRDVRRLAVALFLGIPAQALLGGITVLTGLNPWTVAAHFLLSMALLAIAVVLYHRSSRPDGPAVPIIRPELTWLTRALLVVTAATLAIGTVVTGSGPHSGDPAAGRTGLDPELISQLHVDAVMLLIGLTVATWLALRAMSAPSTAATTAAHDPVRSAAVRAALVLLAVELGQGVIGFVQYFTGLPTVLVGLHLLGACLVWIAALRVSLAGSERVMPVAAAERDAAPVAATVAPATIS